MHAQLEWQTYRYFPYERRFAQREVRALFGVQPEETASGLSLPAASFRPELAEHLTYFARAVPPSGPVVVPRQARLEQSATERSQLRQSTRYSAHGLHDYKGKFNPQVVRAIGNILGLRQGAWVLDPFSGSGTTLLESAHVGWNALGFDLNPLAVKVANAKLSALQLSDGRLARASEHLQRELTGAADLLSHDTAPSEGQLVALLDGDWTRDLAGAEYLSRWFPRPVLAQLVALQRALGAIIPDSATRSVFEIIFSNQLRAASLREPADLRVRRRKNPQPNYPLLGNFLAAVAELVPRVERARSALGPVEGVRAARRADVRADGERIGQHRPPEGFDAVITSPPYATALPYIDTQRLSLVSLGLIVSSAIQETETALIGAREVRTRQRRELELELTSPRAAELLPQNVLAICRELLEASKLPGNGFRRRNKPSLVYRYFRDMRRFFETIRPHMKLGAPCALVVGTNRTTLGGQAFVIDTPSLLGSVAESAGFHDVRCGPMETYPRYELHQRNSIHEEMLVMVHA